MGINAAGLDVSGGNNPNWKGGLIGKICIFCGSQFEVIYSRKDKAKCCSLPCWNKLQKKMRPNWYEGKRKGKPKADSEKTLKRLAGNTSLSADGCIEWAGKLNSDGYGTTSWNRKHWLAHRLMWTLVKGPIEDGMCILHRCDNPKCVNTDHLFMGTHTENMRDMASKGRSSSQKRSQGRQVAF